MPSFHVLPSKPLKSESVTIHTEVVLPCDAIDYAVQSGLTFESVHEILTMSIRVFEWKLRKLSYAGYQCTVSFSLVRNFWTSVKFVPWHFMQVMGF